MTDNQKTPLFDIHSELGAKLAPFAGWDMPIQYEGILAEHFWTRNEASIFDTCHMGELELRGPTAEADLEKLLTLRVKTIKEGQCRYGFLLNESGGVIDDLTCYRRGPEHFFLVVNAGTREADVAWIQSHLSADTQFTDLSPTRAKLDVQGPKAKACIEATLGESLPELGYFKFTDHNLAGIPMTISRTGYTGEWGYEFYFDANHAADFWNKLTASGTIKPAGLGARDTLRLEMGYALYGHELSEQSSPVGVTGGSFISFRKDFIGHDICQQDLEALEGGESAEPRKLVGLKLESKRAARAHDTVVSGGQVVGEVTSGSVSPSLNVAIAMALVDATACNQELAISVRGKELPCQVVELPFWGEGSARG